MRRLATLGLVLLALGTGMAVLARASAQGSSTGTFDVIFDDARGLVPGQLVKVAGAQAGTIQNVTVTSDFKARIEASIDSQFLPFHQDATCTIRPQGLIGENYVECDPGSANRPPLQAAGGQPPTVPVSHTTEPVSLLDLFNIFNQPTRERLTVLINELGIATSAQGSDINDVIRRANPALGLARQVIGILDNQREQLKTIVDATNTIAANGAGHTAGFQNFLDRAAALSTLTANHSSALAEAIKRLPGMLAATEPALKQLDTVAVDGTPLVNQIHASVPAVNQATAALGPFVKAARPGLADLGSAVNKTLPALRASGPLVKTLRAYADRSRAGTLLSAKLFSNLQRHGFTENFMEVFYYIGASLARFDATSHLLSILLISPDNGACGNYATKPVPACSAHYGAQPSYAPTSDTVRAAAARRHSRPRAAERHAEKSADQTPTSTQPPAAAAAAAANTPGSPQQSASALQGLVNYLLR